MPTARSRLGARGERIAREYLEARGYETVATNFRCPLGETDIIARDGACLVFVEVRTRRSPESYGAPEESLSRAKRNRLVATAETYIQNCETPPEEWRIDLVAVHLDISGAIKRVEHIENALQLS
jgi:putative endonuclease